MASPTAPRTSAPQVIIAHLDGKRSRGYVFDFSPMRDQCRVFPSATAAGDQGEIIDLKTLKAVFFLNEPSGEQPSAQPSGPSHGRKVEVVFSDGERMQGATQGYSPERLGFFMVPEDPTGKILRAFIINANVKQVRWL